MSKAKPPPVAALSASSGPRTPVGRGPRTPRTPRRVEAQPTRLEAVDDSLGPLGPLGDNVPLQSEAEPVPVPPLKEQSLPVRNLRPTSSTPDARMGSSMLDSVDLGQDGEAQMARSRYPPPVQPAQGGSDNRPRQTQPSMSIEQAAKPTFDITVGDPHKVGDLTSSHIVYQVRTKVMHLRHSHGMITILILLYRHHPRHISNPNLQSVGGTATSYGCTIHCTTTILGLLFRLHQRSRQLGASTQALWNHAVKPWNEC